jgi:dienelactone hydrolase
MPLPGSLQLKSTNQIGICRHSPISVAGFPASSLETGREAPAHPASRLPPLAVMRRWRFIGLAVVAILLLGIAARRYVHGFTLVIRAADLHGPVRRAADLDTVLISERIVRARVEDASIRARVYAPVGTARQTVLLVSGLHPAGIDEPRLVALARRLAEANVTVVTPEIPELSRFEIAPIVTDRIEQAAVWLAAESELAPTGRIGLMGISFSGGLAVVAAGRPSLRNHLLYVFSFGGHDDLRRVLEYFCTGIEHEALAYSRQEPGATKAIRPPHDYGLAIVLLNIVDHLVPPEQVAPLREAVRRFLWASYLDRVDKPQAEREFAALRELARTLPEPAATLLGYVNNRDVTHLGPQLLPYIGFYVDAPALSPSRSPKPSVPVFLLHGRDDNVIPAVESQYLADRLRGQVPVRLLLTNLISHAEADQPAHVTDVMRLACFWGDLLGR